MPFFVARLGTHARPTGTPLTQRAFAVHPAEQSGQWVNFVLIGPRGNGGINDQFWVQMELSSRSFQGIGVKRAPRTDPPAKRMTSLRVSFIGSLDYL
jgi:hypothetical protein